jgi:hypothetical protein
VAVVAVVVAEHLYKGRLVHTHMLQAVAVEAAQGSMVARVDRQGLWLALAAASRVKRVALALLPLVVEEVLVELQVRSHLDLLEAALAVRVAVVEPLVLLVRHHHLAYPPQAAERERAAVRQETILLVTHL